MDLVSWIVQGISDNIGAVIGVFLTGIATWVGNMVVKFFNSQRRERCIKTAVAATEQLHKDIHGQDKYDQAVSYAIQLLAEENLTATPFQIKMIIEKECRDFAKRNNPDGSLPLENSEVSNYNAAEINSAEEGGV